MINYKGEDVKAYDKKMIARELAASCDITYKDAKYVIDAFFGDVFLKILKTGQPINIKGVGTFSVLKNKARVGVNNKGEKVNVRSYLSVKFKQSEKFKKQLNGWGDYDEE